MTKQLLVDTIPFKISLTEGSRKELPNGRIYVEGKAQQCGVVNKNRRRYPLEKTWGRHVKEGTAFMQRVLGHEVFGHLEHPENGRSDLRQAAVKLEKVWMTGEQVNVGLSTLSNSLGKDAAALFRDGLTVGISSRATGSVVQAPDGVDEVQEDFEPETFDLVADPSTPGAKFVAERISESYNKLAAVEVKTLQEDERRAIEEAKRTAMEQKAPTMTAPPEVEPVKTEQDLPADPKSVPKKEQEKDKDDEDPEKKKEQDKVKAPVREAISVTTEFVVDTSDRRTMENLLTKLRIPYEIGVKPNHFLVDLTPQDESDLLAALDQADIEYWMDESARRTAGTSRLPEVFRKGERHLLQTFPPELEFVEDEYDVDAWKNNIMWDRQKGEFHMDFTERDMADAIEYAIRKKHSNLKTKIVSFPTKGDKGIFQLRVWGGTGWVESTREVKSRRRISEQGAEPDYKALAKEQYDILTQADDEIGKLTAQMQGPPTAKQDIAFGMRPDLASRYNKAKKEAVRNYKHVKEQDQGKEPWELYLQGACKYATESRKKVNEGMRIEVDVTKIDADHHPDLVDEVELQLQADGWDDVRSFFKRGKHVIIVPDDGFDVSDFELVWKKANKVMSTNYPSRVYTLVYESVQEATTPHVPDYSVYIARPDVPYIMYKRVTPGEPRFIRLNPDGSWTGHAGKYNDAPVTSSGKSVSELESVQEAEATDDVAVYELSPSELPGNLSGRDSVTMLLDLAVKNELDADIFYDDEDNNVYVVIATADQKKLDDIMGTLGVKFDECARKNRRKVMRIHEHRNHLREQEKPEEPEKGKEPSKECDEPKKKEDDEPEKDKDDDKTGEDDEEPEKDDKKEAVLLNLRRGKFQKDCKRYLAIEEATKKLLETLVKRNKELEKELKEREERIKSLTDLNEAMDDLQHKEALAAEQDKILKAHPQLGKALHILNKAVTMDEMRRTAQELLNLLPEKKEAPKPKAEEKKEVDKAVKPAIMEGVEAAKAGSDSKNLTEELGDPLARLARYRRSTK